MSVAQVIVDIAAKQTDRIFEYHVPQEFADLQVGARVFVPFGRRKLQGFVVGLSPKSHYPGKLRDLLLVVDEISPLTPELVALSQYLARTVFSYRISILQAMLPGVMRANYRKILTPQNPQAAKLPIFNGKALDLTNLHDVSTVKKVNELIKKGQAKVEYLVENRAKKKWTFQYQPVLELPAYQKYLQQSRKNAWRQKRLLTDILEHPAAYPKNQHDLEQELHVDSSFLQQVVKKGWLSQKKVAVLRNPLAQYQKIRSASIELNAEQKAALEQIKPAISQQQNETFLLEGVTGSGKTEVYLHAIENCLKSGRNSLMLVPEISLTPQMVSQVKGRFGNTVAVIHSGLSEGEKYDEWRRIRKGQAKVVVGARSAVFAPLKNIGLIVIDEEHESSYKQETNPRYQARDVALWRCKYNQCPLLLGSATPSLGSRARAQKGVYHLLRLRKRANQKQLPQVKVIDLKTVQFAGAQLDLAKELVEKIKEKLARQEQVILLLNRRGFANFMLCRNCGFVMRCPNCDLSLTMHKDTGQMQCHYCGYTCPIPQKCPHCQSAKIRFLGSGTQKVKAELENLLPQAKILRMDVDTTRRKGSYKKILDSFAAHQADILLGTQMIAKGLDFPNVTLVGVINADTGLWIPDYNASEKTFDLLTQVAGRAGRADKQGEVLIQTYNPEHYAIKFACSQDYEKFYHYEMQVRHAGDYPPFYYTFLISVASKNSQQAAKEAFAIKRKLEKHLHQSTIILGPAPAAISKLKKQYYYQILLKYKKESNLNGLLHEVQDTAQLKAKQGLDVYIDNEPEKIN